MRRLCRRIHEHTGATCILIREQGETALAREFFHPRLEAAFFGDRVVAGALAEILEPGMVPRVVEVAGDDAHRKAEVKVTDLLTSPLAVVEHSSLNAGIVSQLKQLTDGDAGTAVKAVSTDQSPLEIVYGFGGQTVSLERFAVIVGAADGAAGPPGSVDLLVSTLSPHAGFRSIRCDPLRDNREAQEFPFAVTAAKWVMLRFKPANKTKAVCLAEIRLTGLRRITSLARPRSKRSTS